MVSIEELLERVQQADTETGRQWILLELQMSQMSDELVSMLWAAAVPHFFDAEVLATLRPELAGEAEKLFADLQMLTFVEEFPGYGYNIHELTREVLLGRLCQNERKEFLVLSKRAANYFSEVGTTSEEEVEFSYHEILDKENSPSERLLDRVIDWWDYYQPERIQAACQSFLEHERAQRLDASGHSFSLYLTGLLKRLSANYKDAEALFSQSLENYENSDLKNQRYMAMLLRDLSITKYKQGNVQSAVSICERALKISEEQLGPAHSDTATSLNNLAGFYESVGQYDEAGPLYLRALNINEEQLGATHPTTANSLNNLAGFYESVGRYDEAEPLYLRALNIREEQLGPTHPDTANSLNNLATLYVSISGRYDEAEPLYLRALKISEEQLGLTHPDTANSLSNLAELYRKQERLSEAILLLEKWRSIKRERKETHNQSYAGHVRVLGNLYEKCQNFSQAVEVYEESVAIFNQILGSKHPAVLILKGEMRRLKKRMKQQSKSSKQKDS